MAVTIGCVGDSAVEIDPTEIAETVEEIRQVAGISKSLTPESGKKKRGTKILYLNRY